MALDGCASSSAGADLTRPVAIVGSDFPTRPAALDKWTDARAIATAQTLAAATSQAPSRQSSPSGLSSSAGRGALTQAGALLGTPLYMAPETVLDTRGAEPSSDIFSVGLIAYELLTGALPWSEPPVITRLRGAPLGDAPSLGDAMGSLPSEVVALVDQCLALEPTARPTAQQLVRALSGLAATRTGAPLPGLTAQGTEVAESSRFE
jgi:serine/threonine protein kinase